MSFMIKSKVFGVFCSVKEVKFLNSDILAVESFMEEEKPVFESD